MNIIFSHEKPSSCIVFLFETWESCISVVCRNTPRQRSILGWCFKTLNIKADSSLYDEGQTVGVVFCFFRTELSNWSLMFPSSSVWPFSLTAPRLSVFFPCCCVWLNSRRLINNSHLFFSHEMVQCSSRELNAASLVINP